MAITIVYPQFEEAEHLEVCPSCGGIMKAGNYICKCCRRQPNTPMVLSDDKPEFRPKKYNKTSVTDSICGNCQMLEACRERVENGMWICCEIPSQEDMLIAKLGGER